MFEAVKQRLDAPQTSGLSFRCQPFFDLLNRDPDIFQGCIVEHANVMLMDTTF
jgi:hypothetical protein